MDYYHFLELKPDRVYARNDYGGVDCFKLDWEQDCSYCKGDLQDQYESLQDLFEELECVLDIKELI